MPKRYYVINTEDIRSLQKEVLQNKNIYGNRQKGLGDQELSLARALTSL